MFPAHARLDSSWSLILEDVLAPVSHNGSTRVHLLVKPGYTHVLDAWYSVSVIGWMPDAVQSLSTTVSSLEVLTEARMGPFGWTGRAACSCGLSRLGCC